MAENSWIDKLKATSRRSGALWTASLVLDRLGLPALGWWKDRIIDPDQLEKQVSAVLQSWGMSDADIAITTQHMMYPDLHGIDSHGSAMLLQYHRWLQQGALSMSPEIQLISDQETTALIDGGGALGHVPADRAMRLAIVKCQAQGMGAVAVRNSRHFGAAGSYVALAAQEGLIGLATTNVLVPAQVPTHGVDARLGTNPIAFAAPAGRNRPFLLDMATSTVPVGKLMTAWRTGRSIPRGWAQDAKGNPVTRPRKAFKQRRVTPLGGDYETGGHKGYGLAAMVEILSAVLPGEYGAGGVGHFFLALDPGRFLPGETFGQGLDELLDNLRSTPQKRADEPVLVAGDPEYAAAEAAQRGIALSRCVVEDIRAVCEASGVRFILDKPDGAA